MTVEDVNVVVLCHAPGETSPLVSEQFGAVIEAYRVGVVMIKAAPNTEDIDHGHDENAGCGRECGWH